MAATTITSTPITLTPINSSFRIPALDGLRGIAILLVVLFHAVFVLKFSHHFGLDWLMTLGRMGWSGVDLFFVLSGFLIGGILLDARDSPSYFKVFYARRAFRILPVYFVVVTLAWLTVQAGNHGWLPEHLGSIFASRLPWWSYFTFTQNVWFTAVGTSGTVLSVTWSLAVEEQFYLVLPFLIRYIPRKYLLSVVVVLTIGAPLLRMILMQYYAHGAIACYVLMPCRADALGLGVLSAMLVRMPEVYERLVRRRKLIYGMSFLLGGAVFLIAFTGYESFTSSLHGLEYSVLALFYASVLLIAVTGEDLFVRVVLCNKPLMKLGMVAYGTYLFHGIFIQAFHYVPAQKSGITFVLIIVGTRLLAAASSIALAGLFWHFFEKPLLRHGHVYKYSPPPSVAGSEGATSQGVA